MIEGEAIKIAMLHLEGEAHDWWFHGLTTLGDAGKIAYDDFTRRVLEWFECNVPNGTIWGFLEICRK